MAETPSCCDTEWDLVRKILLELQSMVINQALVTPPIPSDGLYELYRKILLTLPLI